MAITINTQPTEDSFVAAASPVWIEAETDAEETTYTITGVADSSGSVELTASSFTGVAINNVLTIFGATGDYAYLNGRHDVLSAGSTTVVISATYQAASTGTRGARQERCGGRSPPEMI